jgi:hypothetical protein
MQENRDSSGIFTVVVNLRQQNVARQECARVLLAYNMRVMTVTKGQACILL